MEALLFGFLGVVILGVAYFLLTRSVSLTDATSRSIELQVGVRNLMENLVNDVNGAHLFLDPAPKPAESTLVVARYKERTAVGRLAANPRPAYPFLETGDQESSQVLPVLRATYSFDEARGTVSRKLEEGTLTALPGDDDPGRLAAWTFHAERTLADKVLARSVEEFTLSRIGYDRDGKPAAIETLSEPLQARTACVVVKLRSLFREGAYGDGRRAPEVVLLTKVWSYRRLYDRVYKEYFSSVDEDLRY